MRAPWHIRAWATGASLAINGALALGVMHMAPTLSTVAQDETAILVSLGDPSQPDTDNATSPDSKPASEPEGARPAPSPVAPPEKVRVTPPTPDAWTVAAPPAKPTPPTTSTAEADARSASSTPAAAPAAAKAMAVTAAKPPAGSDRADSVQAHAGSSNSYIALVRALLESNKAYPRAARMRKQQGVARVVFVIDRSGHLLDCRLTALTGHPLLDQEALAMVARSDPFPPPPHTIRGERIELDAPVEFSLAR